MFFHNNLRSSGVAVANDSQTSIIPNNSGAKVLMRFFNIFLSMGISIQQPVIYQSYTIDERSDECPVIFAFYSFIYRNQVCNRCNFKIF